MATATETWYVRLPDGRTVRARSADVLRSYVRAGRIPLDSRVRRSADNEWIPLSRIPEFAAAVGAEQPRPHADDAAGAVHSSDNDMRTVGVRGLVEELLSALDSSIHRSKLTVAVLTGLALALGLIALGLAVEFPPGPWTVAGQVAAALFMLAAVALETVFLTQMTYIELDRHRPARAAELRDGLLRHSVRVMVAQGLVAGVLIGLVWLLRAAGPWLTAHDIGELNGSRDVLLVIVAVVRLLLEVICWPILGLALLLLGPMLVIEEYSIVRGLREWLGLIRRHIGRVYLYEALAFMLGAVLAAPLLLVVAAAWQSVGDGMGLAERITLTVLGGVALTPMIAYLTVANVFIYLNLRYEFFHSSRPS